MTADPTGHLPDPDGGLDESIKTTNCSKRSDEVTLGHVVSADAHGITE